MNAFVGTPLTQHIGYTPESYVICRSVPLSRVGWQKYKGREIGPELEPERVYRVWRDESQVFAKAAMASAEGKSVTRTHPPLMLDSSNTASFQRGHCQNVRRDGDHLVADLVITCPLLCEEILSGRLREISCGYTCHYIPLGDDEFAQEDIRINHIAVVEDARAGSRIAIQDGGTMEKNRELREALDQLKQTVVLCQDRIRAQKLRAQAREIQKSADRTGELTRTGIGPGEFHRRLAEQNAAYASYSASMEAGKEFSDLARKVGEEMGNKFLKGVTDAAPVRVHADPAENFCAAARRVGAQMRGE